MDEGHERAKRRRGSQRLLLPPLPPPLFQNEQENPDFVQLVTAMEARRNAVGAPPLQYLYPTNGGVSKATASALVAAGVDPAAIAPDCHVGGGGGIGCAKGDFSANPDFNQSFINCETNAAISTMDRALQESADLQEWFNFGAAPGEQPERLIARTASFCAERSGHYDAFDQGISFFLPNMTWLQPPGYVHAMITATWQPNALPIQAGPVSSFPQPRERARLGNPLADARP